MKSFASLKSIYYRTFKRLFDISLGVLLLGGMAPIMILIAIAIKMTSQGNIIFWSWRVGNRNRLFRMPKYRTMYQGTPNVATHLMTDPDRFVTPIGRFLRKTSLDELPQLTSVLKGDMSFVGPRPALYNQEDLISLRTEAGIHRLTPGITGWAQVNGRDELPIPLKVTYDAYYALNQSLCFDLHIIGMTVLKVYRSEGVNH